MIRIAMLLLLAAFAWSEVIEASYKIEYGVFGKVGASDALLETNATSYHIEVVGEATGFAKVLTGGRKERYISTGKVIDGRLVPEKFIKSRIRRNKRSDKYFIFDHEKKVVYAKKRVYENGKLVSDGKPNPLPYYAKDDLFTLYFNIFDQLKKLPVGSYRFHAVGGDRKDGAVDIVIPDAKTLKKLKKRLKSDGFYFIAIIHQKIFASKEGALYIVADDDGVAKKALLKDVIMFGDIVGKLVKKRVSDR